ncbi:glycosyltransferase family 4 protein [Oceanicella sp. SM1341]|uniref:glycosyltransferase family 4 protein n=1 Tax=Oceanicella sp. SM1341 TaxID=1548889 RepID=UPI000E532710|nr:glycosyltransferase family 4 protein [Oceanicella sp. SM1341]
MSGAGRGARIVILNDFSRARGGATGLALLSARLLAERGREVVYLCGDAGENPELAAAGVTLRGAGGRHVMARGRAAALMGGLYNAGAARFVRDWIAAEGRPDDVYHLHGWSKILSPAVFSALAPVRGRLVVHAHDFFLACPNGGYWNYPRAEACALTPLSAACLASRCDKRNQAQKLWRVARAALRRALFSFDETGPEVLMIHPAMAPLLVRGGLPASRLTVLRNPVTPFRPPRVAAEAGRYLLFAGRLDPEKGGLALARAAARAGVPLRVAGEGPEEAAIRAACPGVEMLGWKSREEIGVLAAGARALVMPSLYPEPFGLVAVEALGCGLPVVAAKTAFLAGEIVAAGAGLAVDVADEAGFAAALAGLMQDDAAVARMSRNAVAVAPSLGLTPEAWCDGLEAACARAAAGTGDWNGASGTGKWGGASGMGEEDPGRAGGRAAEGGRAAGTGRVAGTG